MNIRDFTRDMAAILPTFYPRSPQPEWACKQPLYSFHQWYAHWIQAILKRRLVFSKIVDLLKKLAKSASKKSNTPLIPLDKRNHTQKPSGDSQRNQNVLPRFHPQTVLRSFGNGDVFRLADAQTGCLAFGATGSGKSSGPGKFLACAYLAHGFGGLVLCAKPEDRQLWEQYAAECGRTEDLVIIDQSGQWCFNFINWEAERPKEGGGFGMNVVYFLVELATAIRQNASQSSGGKGEDKFWEDALQFMVTNLVDLGLLAGVKLSLPLLRSLANSAPLTLEQSGNPEWLAKSACGLALTEINETTKEGDREIRADFEECQNYFLSEFPGLSDRTRSIVVLTLSMLMRPFMTRPLRKLFAEDTNIRPDDACDGKIIIVDLPVQEFRLVGRIANLTWKYAFQTMVMRRSQPGDRKSFLRPVFLWADEAQNFVSRFDTEYQAVARSGAGCTVYLTQNRESFLRVLGSEPVVDSLLGNLQCKIFCQNSGETNEWASKLLGQRYIHVVGTNVGSSQNASPDGGGHSSGIDRKEDKRFFIEPAQFTTLRRGGEQNNFLVDCIVYNGGHVFKSTGQDLPYKLLTFKQK